MAQMKTISPVLTVEDVEDTVAYFRDQLGFTAIDTEDPSIGVVQRDSARIVLIPRSWDLRCEIEVDDVDGLCAELVDRGAEFDSGPLDQMDGRRAFTVLTPDGSAIVFWQVSAAQNPEPLPPPDEEYDDSTPF